MPTVKELLLWGVKELEESSSTAHLDAELLLSFSNGLSRSQLICSHNEKVTTENEESYRSNVMARKQHKPLAYIIGEREFWKHSFIVTPDVLVPRPETELLVELSLAKASTMKGKLRILDLGTGTGCILLSIAVELSAVSRLAHAVGVDQSVSALAIAKRNAEKLDLLDTVQFAESDWFSALQGERFDIIVANPPYVSLNATDVSPELAFEPSGALFAGQDGLSSISLLLSKCEEHLVDQGVFLCEIGSGQKEQIVRFWESRLSDSHPNDRALSFYRDLAGFDRVLEVSRR